MLFICYIKESCTDTIKANWSYQLALRDTRQYDW